MKSKITIEFDEDNRPIIQIAYTPSDDVRDKLVGKFLSTFDHHISWAKFTSSSINNSASGLREMATIRPITPQELEEEAKTMTVWDKTIRDPSFGFKEAEAVFTGTSTYYTPSSEVAVTIPGDLIVGGNIRSK